MSRITRPSSAGADANRSIAASASATSASAPRSSSVSAALAGLAGKAEGIASTSEPAIASHFSGFLVGMAISGLGFGVYAAVDLALVVDVLPDKRSAAKDLGVFNIAGALPFSIAPAIAPAILAIGHGSYGVLYAVAGLCAILGAFAILPVRRVR